MSLSPEEVANSLAIPSEGLRCRGQRDGVGFARTAEQMAAVWAAAADGPESLDPRQSDSGPSERRKAERRKSEPNVHPDVVGAICPHDDYLYAGRVYREILPALQPAQTIVLVGVFHGYRRFGIRDRLVFEPFERWRTPDGSVAVSALREAWISELPSEAFLTNAGAHEYEHSLEALVYWLHHQRPDLTIVPLLVPAMAFPRMQSLAKTAAEALLRAASSLSLSFGADFRVAISADATHYGDGFSHTPFGRGGPEAYERAVDRDLAILGDLVHGPLTREGAERLYATFVDPQDPDTYRVTWCGRFSIPFGLLLINAMAPLGDEFSVEARAYATSVGWPQLALRESGLGTTAPSNLYHFVGYPGAWILADHGNR